MTSKLEAEMIVQREVLPTCEGFCVGNVVSIEEITWSAPNVYGVDLSGAWIVHLERTEIFGPESSTIVAVDRSTGTIKYHGSAGDEG